MSTLPKHIQQVFVETFTQIPQRVLWKYDGDIKNLPDNIMTRNWFPQRDILRELPEYLLQYIFFLNYAHSNCSKIL